MPFVAMTNSDEDEVLGDNSEAVKEGGHGDMAVNTSTGFGLDGRTSPRFSTRHSSRVVDPWPAGHCQAATGATNSLPAQPTQDSQN